MRHLAHRRDALWQAVRRRGPWHSVTMWKMNKVKNAIAEMELEWYAWNDDPGMASMAWKSLTSQVRETMFHQEIGSEC